MNFSQRLTTIMKKSNISAYKMAADLSSVSEAMIGKWKNGKSLPSFENIILLSNYLGVSCDYLLTGSEPESDNLYDDEKRIFNYYQKLNEDDKMKARGYIKELYERSEAEKFYEENAKLA